MVFAYRVVRAAVIQAAFSLVCVSVWADDNVAKPDLAKGQQIASQVCVACHGADGNSVSPAYPRLAGLPAEYIVKQLADFTKPATDATRRDNPVMLGMASTLSETDRKSVALWFSKQTPKADLAKVKDSAEAGQKIYKTGIAERSVPACAGCHGPTGAGLPVLYPRIGGQHSDYIISQLKAFRAGTRKNNAAMAAIAPRLTDEDINALAEYISGLRSMN